MDAYVNFDEAMDEELLNDLEEVLLPRRLIRDRTNPYTHFRDEEFLYWGKIVRVFVCSLSPSQRWLDIEHVYKVYNFFTYNPFINYYPDFIIIGRISNHT